MESAWAATADRRIADLRITGNDQPSSRSGVHATKRLARSFVLRPPLHDTDTPLRFHFLFYRHQASVVENQDDRPNTLHRYMHLLHSPFALRTCTSGLALILSSGPERCAWMTRVSTGVSRILISMMTEHLDANAKFEVMRQVRCVISHALHLYAEQLVSSVAGPGKGVPGSWPRPSSRLPHQPMTIDPIGSTAQHGNHCLRIASTDSN